MSGLQLNLVGFGSVKVITERLMPMRFYLLLLLLDSMMMLRVKTLLFSSRRLKLSCFSTASQSKIACQNDKSVSDDYLFGTNTKSFQELGLSSDITDSLELLEQTKATMIQAKAIPLILTGKDVVISSETGSGKTFAYLLPLIQKCIEAVNSDSIEPQVPSSSNEVEAKFTYPKVVVLVPNKDLAAQVVKMGSRVLGNLTESKIPVTIGALTRNVGNDRWPLRKDCPTILVCTPVIISNFVRGPIVKDEVLFNTIQHLVLDEADMLVEGSYQVEMEKIMEALKKSRRAKIRDGLIDMKTKTCQYILAAATLPNSGKYSVESYTKKMFPFAEVVSNEHVHKLHPQIEQQFVKVYGDAQEGVCSESRIQLIVDAIARSAARTSDSDMAFLSSSITAPVDSVSATTTSTSAVEETAPLVEKSAEWSIDELFPETDKGLTSPAAKTALLEMTPEIYARVPHTMVFVNEVETVQQMARKLNRAGVKSVEFHKGLLPSLKESYLESFQSGESRVIVCTDHASRGLDLPYVRHVVQGEFATNVVQYLHRIGRCSRAGRKGFATNFYDVRSEDLVSAIVSGGESNQSLSVEAPDSVMEGDGSGQNVPSSGVKPNASSSGTSVTQAFSRRRGFRRTIKRARELEQGQGQGQGHENENYIN